jgi:hypothetical protein
MPRSIVALASLALAATQAVAAPCTFDGPRATFAELIAATRRRGYRFVTLDEALQDPAYARPDGYNGRFGPSWLHRWAMAEKKPKQFYAGEPVVPRWVLALAEVESE